MLGGANVRRGSEIDFAIAVGVGTDGSSDDKTDRSTASQFASRSGTWSFRVNSSLVLIWPSAAVLGHAAREPEWHGSTIR